MGELEALWVPQLNSGCSVLKFQTLCAPFDREQLAALDDEAAVALRLPGAQPGERIRAQLSEPTLRLAQLISHPYPPSPPPPGTFQGEPLAPLPYLPLSSA